MNKAETILSHEVKLQRLPFRYTMLALLFFFNIYILPRMLISVFDMYYEFSCRLPYTVASLRLSLLNPQNER